jgi:hypothetical protein
MSPDLDAIHREHIEAINEKPSESTWPTSAGG